MNGANLNWVRLPLKHALNTRELGGYPTKDGSQTKWHAFLRADDLSQLDEQEIGFLKEYGVRTILDLRSQDECIRKPNPFSKDVDVAYHNVSFAEGKLGGRKIADLTDMDINEINVKPSDFYIHLIETHETVKELFTTIEQAETGGILFHCRAGKDRTGVLSMLLACADVDRQDIITNYEVTFTNILSAFQNLHHKKNSIPDIFCSRPEFIGDAYDYILKTYGSFGDYFQSVGITAEQLVKIRRRLVLQFT